MRITVYFFFVLCWFKLWEEQEGMLFLGRWNIGYSVDGNKSWDLSIAKRQSMLVLARDKPCFQPLPTPFPYISILFYWISFSISPEKYLYITKKMQFFSQSHNKQLLWKQNAINNNLITICQKSWMYVFF